MPAALKNQVSLSIRPYQNIKNPLMKTHNLYLNYRICIINVECLHPEGCNPYFIDRVVVKEKITLNSLLMSDTGCLNKKASGTNMPVSLKLDKHLNIILGIIC